MCIEFGCVTNIQGLFLAANKFKVLSELIQKMKLNIKEFSLKIYADQPENFIFTLAIKKPVC